MNFKMFLKPILIGTVLLFASCQNDYDDKVVRVVQDATVVTCSAPTNLGTTAITQTSATASWIVAGSETSWEVYIGAAGSAAPTGSGTVTATNSYTFTGLTTATSYQFYVRAICSATDSSAWSGPLVFTTN